MELICATCSQPNPAGAKLCSRCSSIFPPTHLEALAGAADSAPPATATAAGTLADVARRPEAFASETVVAASGAASATETLVAAASAGGETLVAPSGPPPEAPHRRTPAPRTPSRGNSPPAGARFDAAAVAAGSLQPGDHLGTRYEIVRLLGKGGMGAVYLARDLDLGRDVAMKLIAPHLANDTGVLERFKREIQLSSIVTHQNVLRVYDLGESDGLKFLTMQYIEGETLADVIARERPLPIEKTLSFLEQICEALAAAHEKGVLHRDLKPQNVMLDAGGRVYLMDFGLATSRAVTAMTQVGAIMGTPQYMSPEQVKGTQTDARSDIFSLGVMLYEMLSGELPFNGDSLFEIMIKRTQGPPRPVGELNPATPEYLRQLLDRCLAVDPLLRYHDLQELLFDLQAGSVATPLKKRRGPSRKALLLGAALLAAVVAGGVATTVARRAATQENVAAKPVTVLVADFDNRTGEDVFNGTLEPAFGTALEGASFVTLYNRGMAQRLADRLKLEGSALSEKRARLVAQREGVGVVATGFVEREGTGYRVGVRAVDAFTGQRIVEQTDVVGEKRGALAAMSKLAAAVRQKLGDKTPQSVQLKEAETYSAASLEAAHAYALGADLAVHGKWDDAKTRYLEATRLDPNMGRAYSGIASIEANLGRRADAMNFFKEAMARLDRMTDREKYRTLGSYYIFSRDVDRAVDAYTALLKQFPGDSAGLVNLGYSYTLKHDFARALDAYKRAVELSPNEPGKRSNYGYAALFGGDVDKALEQEAKAVELSPVFLDGYIGLAMAQLVAGKRDESLETWNRLRSVSPAGASIAAEGLADLAMYEGRLGDARAILDAAIKADLATKDVDGAARKNALLAELRAAVRDRRGAESAAQHALAASDAEPVLYGAATTYLAIGERRKAAAVADTLSKRMALDARTYAEMLRGAIESDSGDHVAAVTRLKTAVGNLDAWIARFALARAYFAAGAYPSALDEFDTCDKRRGQAADAFQATVPTYRLAAAAKYHLARTHEALKSPAAAETYQAFLAIKRSDEDPMVQDARKRLAALTAAAASTPAAAAR